jgi:cupin 2 domain-containing protein
MTKNLFALPEHHGPGELFTVLASADGFSVERIASWGDVTPAGEWYDQDHDEWVVVLQGEGTLEDERGNQTTMKPGDWLLLPARLRHRVVHTSHTPPCIWLAVHGPGSGPLR